MITNRSNRSSSEIFSFFPYLDLLRDFFINKQEKQNIFIRKFFFYFITKFKRKYLFQKYDLPLSQLSFKTKMRSASKYLLSSQLQKPKSLSVIIN
jgi:hypothetical protein